MHEIFDHPDAFELRPAGPRTFRLHRQRAKSRFDRDTTKDQSARRTGEGRMEVENAGEEEESQAQWSYVDKLIDRTTLCLPHFGKDSVVHGGEDGFKDVLRQYFPMAESNATERLVELKNKLRTANTHDFWAILMEEMCDITGSQCGFVAKRMLVDDQDSAVEMPELGEPGSCLMGVAFYINNGRDVKKLYRDYRYHAYGTPCAHMKYDKVFIVPERMTEFVRDNPNTMPWAQSEAFIGVPLFSEGKSFAHIGMVWSSEGASTRKLGWNFIEMFLHSLEDMILQRILEGRGFSKDVAAPESTSAKVIPLSAITASQSLKPYARSLSHELRTPMQGVVGMLDIMYSTVLDAIATQHNDRVRAVFKDLKAHIEVVQDSSKRAVEAADNVVHAYDLNMQMPETPLTPEDSDMRRATATPGTHSSRGVSPAKDMTSFSSPAGKKRERADDTDFHPGPPLKKMFTMNEAEILQTYYSVDATERSVAGPSITMTETSFPTRTSIESEPQPEMASSDKKNSPILASGMISPTHRRVVTRDFMRSLLNDALRSGHPTNEVHTETELGERIEIRTVGSRGEVQEMTVYLEIEPDVPEAIITEEQHLQFSLQKLVDNAIKFTESGSITVSAKLGRSAHVVEIWVVDTGCGIAEESMPNVFKPHFQEDASVTRSRDGLGLSLFNAKAHVRKNLGGDVTLERSATDGPSKGSEFLIRLPITNLDSSSLNTPLVGTPPPSAQPSRPSPSPWSDPYNSSNANSYESTSTTRSTQSRPSPPRPSPPKRTAFNPQLARDYRLNILIAEDNAINRNVAIGSLSKLGYSNENITIAFDGVEAVDHYKASLSKPTAERFNAILMDIWMPNMDGYEATCKILDLARENGESTTIIAVTADITEDCVERAKAAGMQGFLAKPYKVLDIENLIVETFPKS